MPHEATPKIALEQSKYAVLGNIVVGMMKSITSDRRPVNLKWQEIQDLHKK